MHMHKQLSVDVLQFIPLLQRIYHFYCISATSLVAIVIKARHNNSIKAINFIAYTVYQDCNYISAYKWIFNITDATIQIIVTSGFSNLRIIRECCHNVTFSVPCIEWIISSTSLVCVSIFDYKED